LTQALAPPVVLYDANLLYPFHIRNLLVQLGVNRLVAPRWTHAIHEEWISHLVADRGASRGQLERTRDIMNPVLPEADVRGYEHRIAALNLPDPGDRHVLAAAIEARATIVLTFNLRDFPAANLAQYGITPTSPDALLCDMFASDHETRDAILDEARLNLSRTAPDRAAFLEIIARQGLRGFAATCRSGPLADLP